MKRKKIIKSAILWLTEQVTCICMFFDAYLYMGNYFMIILFVVLGLIVGCLIEEEQRQIQEKDTIEKGSEEMYKLAVVTEQYAGDFEHEMFKACFKDKNKYQIGPYKSMIDNALVVFYENKPSKRKIENILIRLNKWSRENGVNVREVILLDNAKNVLEKYV